MEARRAKCRDGNCPSSTDHWLPAATQWHILLKVVEPRRPKNEQPLITPPVFRPKIQQRKSHQHFVRSIIPSSTAAGRSEGNSWILSLSRRCHDVRHE